VHAVANKPSEQYSSVSELLPLVYDELRKLAAMKIARESPGQTLQATALVHEAYLKLSKEDARFQGQAHFFAAAAESMRRILIDWARQKKTQKRGRDWDRISFAESELLCLSQPEQIVAVSDALLRFEEQEPGAASLVKLCVFGGFPVEQAAALLGMSRATAYRQWAYARAWLKTDLEVDRS